VLCSLATQSAFKHYISRLSPLTRRAGCPHPSACDLYHVDRDALFSYNKLSELFLQRLVAIYVSSHYKVRTIICRLVVRQCLACLMAAHARVCVCVCVCLCV
jgi:tRNA(Met) C34 N-acetyltransferase TmcA